uniref:Uncharacterized protein n=1 Tax=Cannabis sativa TaxID=3483 RepID=A0A803Q1C1_CANSA
MKKTSSTMLIANGMKKTSSSVKIVEGMKKAYSTMNTIEGTTKTSMVKTKEKMEIVPMIASRCAQDDILIRELVTSSIDPRTANDCYNTSLTVAKKTSSIVKLRG